MTRKETLPFLAGTLLLIGEVALSQGMGYVLKPDATEIHICFLGVLWALVIYGMCWGRDTLCYRPHPIFWRLVHTLCLLYFLLLVGIFVSPYDTGIKFVHTLGNHSGFNTPPPDATLAPRAILQDCTLSVPNILHEVQEIYFMAHMLGWLFKMVVIRSWWLCLVYSATFEFFELTFRNIHPHVGECWWDSLFLDFWGANLFGMFLGWCLLKYFKVNRMGWLESLPDSRSQLQDIFRYKTYDDMREYVLMHGAWCLALALEITTFFIMKALDLPVNNWIILARVNLLLLLGYSATSEWHAFTKKKVDGLGGHIWLLVLILWMELLVFVKYRSEISILGDVESQSNTIRAWRTSFAMHFLWVGYIKIFLQPVNEMTQRKEFIPSYMQACWVLSWLPLFTLVQYYKY